MCEYTHYVGHMGIARHQQELERGRNMELTLPATMWKLTEVSKRTGLSRSALYREIKNPKGVTGEVRENPLGRLKVVHVGRSVRVREADLVDFLDALAKA